MSKIPTSSRSKQKSLVVMISRVELENLQKENEMIKQNIYYLTDEINNIKDIIRRAINPANKYLFDLDVPSNKKEFKSADRSTKLVELRTKLTAKRDTPTMDHLLLQVRRRNK